MPNLSIYLHFSVMILALFLVLSNFSRAKPIIWLSPEVLRQIRSINEDIIKPPNDKREYRHILLKNDMQILLISDNSSIMGGASLSVKVGYQSDQWEYQGLAHFLEHMLLLGSKKYPTEDYLSKFISAYKGFRNAGTAPDLTMYHFTVLSTQLINALDILADSIVSPSLSLKSMHREIESVDSEFGFQIKTDTFRHFLLLKWLSRKNHDFHKFLTGNRHSLKDDGKSMSLHQALVKFYKQYYSSNLMALVVMGNSTLDHLTEQIVPLFSRISNKKVKRPTWLLNHPYDSSNLVYQVNMVTTQDMPIIEIWFPVPYDSYQFQKHLAFDYVHKLLKRRGPGSLFEELKIQRLVISIEIGLIALYKDYFLFSIEISATDEGFSRANDVMHIVFDYINRMKKQQNIQEWIFRELETMWHVNFKFQDQMSWDRTMQISFSLRDREPRECMHAYPSFRPDLIAKLLENLDLTNFNVFLRAKNFTNMTFEKEKWAGIEYRMEKISQERLKKFQQPLQDMKVDFPKPNEFIPSNLSLVAIDNDENGTISKFPQILHQSNISRVWYKQDLNFRLPKAKIFINFYSPLATKNPKMVSLLQIYQYFILEKIVDHLYQAPETGVSFKLERFDYGLTCMFEGYSEKMDIIIRKFMTILLTQEMTNEDFTEAKLKVTRDIENLNKDNLLEISFKHVSSLMLSYEWPDIMLMNELSGITFEDLLDFRQQLFTKLYMELFAYGNVNKETTMMIHKDVMDTLLAYFHVKPFFSSEFQEKRLVRLQEGKNYLFQVYTDAHKTSSVFILFQADLVNDRSEARARLLSQLMADECYSELRTKEQLGYAASCGVRTVQGTNTVLFFVQGHHDPAYVDSRIEAFLISIEKYLHNLNESTFENFKSSLISTYLKPDETLFEAADNFWKQINNRKHHFGLNKALAENLKNITKAELLKFVKTYLNVKSKERKKLSIYVKSSSTDKPMKGGTPMKSTNAINLKVKVIQHWDELKNHMPFYPLPKSRMNLPPLGSDSVKSSQWN